MGCDNNSRDAHLLGGMNASLEMAECATLRVGGLTDGVLHLTPATCQVEARRACSVRHSVGRRKLTSPAAMAEDGNCAIVPAYHAHYFYLNRLLRGIRTHATDSIRLIVVLSDDAVSSLLDFCTRYPSTCAMSTTAALRLEVTDLSRLVEAEQSERYGYWLSSGAGDAAETMAADKRFRAERVIRSLVESADYTRPLRKGSASAASVGARVSNVYVQALKKLLATALVGCTRAWILDSESVPFRSFSFQSIVDGYWADPVVFHNGPSSEALQLAFPVHRQIGFSWCRNTSKAFHLAEIQCRGALLDSYTSRLLGQPAVEHPFLHNDFWHWDAALTRAAMHQAARTQLELAIAPGVSTAGIAPLAFVEAFARSPAHELLYYSYAEASGRHVHRFEAIESRIDRFYRRAGYAGGLAEVLANGTGPLIGDPGRCRRSGRHPFFPLPHYTTNELLHSNLPHTCELLDDLGYRGVKWFISHNEEKTESGLSRDCLPTLSGFRSAAARIAKSCRPHGRSGPSAGGGSIGPADTAASHHPASHRRQRESDGGAVPEMEGGRRKEVADAASSATGAHHNNSTGEAGRGVISWFLSSEVPCACTCFQGLACALHDHVAV